VAKETVERQVRGWEWERMNGTGQKKIFASPVSERGLICKILKEFPQSRGLKQTLLQIPQMANRCMNKCSLPLIRRGI
jgi:hypothetical protein